MASYLAFFFINSFYAYSLSASVLYSSSISWLYIASASMLGILPIAPDIDGASLRYDSGLLLSIWIFLNSLAVSISDPVTFPIS